MVYGKTQKHANKQNTLFLLISMFLCFALVLELVLRTVDFHWYRLPNTESWYRDNMTRTWWLGSLFLSPPSLSLVSAHEPGYVCQDLVCSLCASGGPVWVFEGQILRAGYYVFNTISQNVKGDEDKIIYMHTYCGLQM